MRDYYRRLDIPPKYTNDEETINDIRNEIETNLSSTKPDIEAAKIILLDPNKKIVYDRTHSTLTLIGQLRALLDINDRPYWKPSKFNDFRYKKPSSKVESKKHISSNSARSFFSDNLGPILIGLGVLGFIFFVLSNDNINQNNRPTSFPSTPYHVAVSALNVRNKPLVNSKVIAKLQKYHTVFLADESQANNDWIEISMKGSIGYVSSKYLKKGDGAQAKYAFCAQSITNPSNGKIFKRVGLGSHTLKVINGPDTDAIVRLQDKSNNTILSFYIKRSSTVTIDDIPEGSYQFQYATGKNFSSSCKRFLDNTYAGKNNDYDYYETKYFENGSSTTIASYTLYRVREGNFSPTSMLADAFFNNSL